MVEHVMHGVADFDVSKFRNSAPSSFFPIVWLEFIFILRSFREVSTFQSEIKFDTQCAVCIIICAKVTLIFQLAK
jgi:hypothetical protein